MFVEVQKNNVYVYLGLGIVLLVCGYILLYSKYFAISKIELARQSDAVNMSLAYESTQRFANTPIFFADKAVIAQSLRNFQPHLQVQSIKKIIPGTLEITLGAYPTLFGFFVGENYYEITENGVIIPASPRESVPVIEPKEADLTGILEYKLFFDPKELALISTFLQTISERYPLLDTIEVQYYLLSHELHITNEK